MTRSRSGRKVLLVGWDSADWKIIKPLLDRGEMPVLDRLVNGGVMGNLSSLEPMLSPMLWTSIATGKRPFKHGVHGFTEVDRELNQIITVSSASCSCKTLWQILNQEGFKTHVVGWFATHPAAPIDGACVSDRYASPASPPGKDWPMPGTAVYPETLQETLGGLRVRPEEIDGEVLSLFVPQAAKVDQARDKRLHQIAIRLAETFSVHAAATHLLEHGSWDFAAVYYRAIDWLCHGFMPFHPPRMSGVYDHEFELYHDVVNSAYRLHDLLLGRLLQLAGEGTTVLLVSDHGFFSDHLRPAYVPDTPTGIAAWHRPTGVFVMRGEGLRRDELVHGASILDITPTVLALFDLPLGRDMNGRALVEAFETPPDLQTIPSWDERHSKEKGETKPPRRSAEEEKLVLQQFVELGYIADPGDDPSSAIAWTERENRWNLALSYLAASRFADALPLLETVYEEWPERRDYAIELALCQLNLGLLEEARETLDALPAEQANAISHLLSANIEIGRRNLSATEKWIQQAEAANPTQPAVRNHIGLARIRLRQWHLAEQAFQKTIEIDPDNPHAHLGLAHAQTRMRRYEEAAESALRAIGLRYDLALAHYQLGIALAHLGDEQRAIVAFETCLKQRPLWTPAHRYLAYLYRRQPNGAATSATHTQIVRDRAARRADWLKVQRELRREAAQRARERAEARHARRAKTVSSDSNGMPPQSSEPLEFLIVSGLPRSGTSLMMQILEAAGLPIMRDHLRRADESNPRGYFEWQEIKQLPRNPYLIEKTHGRVTKVISMLLPSLPKKHRFRVIFMNRAIEEVAASQQKLRQRLSAGEIPDYSEMASQLQQHRDRMLNLLRESANVEVCQIDYGQLLETPDEVLDRVIEFAGLSPSTLQAMRRVIDPKLRHFTSENHSETVASVD